MTELEYTLQQLKNTSPSSEPSWLEGISNRKTPQVEDADTIDGQRILGFDAPETTHFKDGVEIPNAKAQKIQDMYGVDLPTQYKLGEEATRRTKELMNDPRYQEFARSGELDAYNRPLVENEALKNTLISEGLAVPSSRYDSKAQNLYRSKMEKQLRLTGTNDELEAMQKIRDYNMAYMEGKEGGWFNSLGRTADAFQSSAIQTLGSVGDMVSDAVGFVAEKAGLESTAKYLDKWGETLASSEYADEKAGYDRRESDFIKQEIVHDLKNGNYVDAFTKGWSIAPETIAESLPIMFELLVGVGGKAKLASGAVEKLPGVVNALKRNAGYATVVAQETNSQAEQYEEKFGEKVSAGKLGEMVAVNTLMYGLDRMAFKDLLSAKDGLKEMASTVMDAGMKKKLAGGAIAVASGMTKEMGQEYLQTWGEIINANAKNAGDWMEVLGDEASQYEAALGAVLGGVSGANIKAATEVGSAIKDVATDSQTKSTAETIEKEAKDNLLKVESDERLADIADSTVEELQEEITNIETRLADDITPEEKEVLQNDLREYMIAKASKETPQEADVEVVNEGDKYDNVTDIRNRIDELDEEFELADTDRKTEIARAIGELRTKRDDLVELDSTIDAQREKMINEGQDPVEVDRKLEIARKKLVEAGIGEVVGGLEGKKSNIGVELGVRSTDVNGNKGKTLQAADTTDAILNKIAEGELTDEDLSTIAKESTDTNLIERVRNHLREGSPVQKQLKTAYDTIKRNLAKGVGNKELEAIVDDKEKATPERALRMLAILEKNIAKSIKSEKDIQANEGIEIDGEYTRESNVIVQLGKEYVNSYGITLSGKAEDITDAYAELGQKILDFGVSQGTIKITPRKIVATGMVDKEGKFTKDLPMYEKGVTPKGQERYFIKDANTIELTDKKGDRAYAMKNLTELFTPKNYEPVKEEATNEVISDRKLMDTHTGIIQKLQKLEFMVKPEALEILKGMLEQSKKYKSMDEYFRLDPAVKAVLGVENSMSHLIKESESGKNLNRADQLRKTLNALDKLEGKFFYSYESAINQRIHVLETIMEFQGDKYMARQLITGGEYTADGVAKDLIIENLAEEFGYKNEDGSVDEEPVRNPKGVVLAILKVMDNPTYKSSAANIVRMAQKLGMTSPFKAASLMQAQYDVWKAGDGAVTTSYMPEFDMSASGLINTMSNLSGNPEVQKVMNVLMDGTDPYMYLNKFIQGDEELSTLYDIALPGEDIVIDDLRTSLAELKDAGFNMRNLAKSPIMTWFYGSKNSGRLMGNEIAIDMVMNAMKKYDTKALAKINEILSSKAVNGKSNNYVIDMANDGQRNIRDITRADVEVLTKHFTETVGDPYVAQMDAAFPGVTAYRKTMGGIFEILDRIPQWKGTIRTAAGNLLDAKNSGDFKMDVRKEKPMAHEIDGQKIVPINTKFNNRNSFMVNLQHSADAAQLLLSLGELMNRHPELKNGVMTVHDAVYADANLLLELKDIYEQMLEQTATKYDFLDVAIKEAEEAIAAMPDKVDGKPNASKAARIEELDKVKAEMKDEREAKAEFLKANEGRMNFFGSKKYKTERQKVESESIKVEKEISKKVQIKKAIDKVYDAIKKVEDEGMTEVIQAIEGLPISKSMENIKYKILDAIKNGVYTNPVFSKAKDGFWSGADKSINVLMDKRDPITKEAMTPDGLIRALGHETDHAIHLNYLVNNPNATEVRYLMKAVRTITNGWQNIADPKVKERLKYIARPLSGIDLEQAMASMGVSADIAMQTYKVAELISILRNEPNVAEYVAKNVYKSKLAQVWAVIDRMLENIINWVSGKSPEEVRDMLKGDETFHKTMVAMELVQQQAVATNIKLAQNILPAKMKAIQKEMRRKDGKIKTKYRRMAERAGIDIKDC